MLKEGWPQVKHCKDWMEPLKPTPPAEPRVLLRSHHSARDPPRFRLLAPAIGLFRRGRAAVLCTPLLLIKAFCFPKTAGTEGRALPFANVA